MATNDSNLENIFREALQSHESAVSPNVWSGIQAGLGSAATTTGGAVAGGSAFLGKAAAVIGAAGLVTFATVSEVRYHQQEAQTPSVVEHEASNVEEVAAAFESETIEEVAVQELSTPSHSIGEVEESTTNSKENQDEAVASAAPVKEDGLDEGSQEPEKDGSSESSNGPIKTDQSSGTTKEQVAASDAQSTPRPAKEEAQDQESPKVEVAQNEPAQEEEALVSEVVLETPPASMTIKPMNIGLNDCFSVVKCEHAVDFQIIIYERFTGQRVFESKDPNFKWCGDDPESSRQRPGRYHYFYEVIAVDANGVPVQAKSSFYVAR